MFNDETQNFIQEVCEYLHKKELYSTRVYDALLNIMDSDPIEENEYTQDQVHTAAEAAVWRVLRPGPMIVAPLDDVDDLFKRMITAAAPVRWRIHHVSLHNGLPKLTECKHESTRGISANDIWCGFNVGLADAITSDYRLKSAEWQAMSKKARNKYKSDTAYAHKVDAEKGWILEDIIQEAIDYDGVFVHDDDDRQCYVFTKWLDNINDE